MGRGGKAVVEWRADSADTAGAVGGAKLADGFTGAAGLVGFAGVVAATT